MLEILGQLTPTCLADMAQALRQGTLRSGISGHAVKQIVGAKEAGGVLSALSELESKRWSTEQMAVLLEVASQARGSSVQPERLMDLVISGPEVNGVPTRDTLAVMQSLIADARNEVIVVGYAVHNGRKLFAPLAERMQDNPSLDVWFCLNVFWNRDPSTSPSDTVERFILRFYEENWPWGVHPRIYYDARGLEDASTQASLHAKCLICDREKALISSANFTEAAQKRNIEVGIFASHAETVRRLAGYFDGLRNAKILREAKLSEWAKRLQ